MPTDLKEKDLLKEHLSEEHFSDVPQKSDHASEYDKKEKINIESHNGNLSVVYHRLKKRKSKKSKRAFPCLVCKANHKKVNFGSTSWLNRHMKEEHPAFHFQCAKCDKQYASYNACYKHIICTHYLCRHKCEVCGKGFPFPKELKTHMCMHTKKGLIPCTWPKCKKFLHQTKACFSISKHTVSKSGTANNVTLNMSLKISVIFINTRRDTTVHHLLKLIAAVCGSGPIKEPVTRMSVILVKIKNLVKLTGMKIQKNIVLKRLRKKKLKISIVIKEIT